MDSFRVPFDAEHSRAENFMAGIHGVGSGSALALAALEKRAPLGPPLLLCL
uniref:Uncharacterized protein n=1 Tax=Arundo donax TaxID=35708 RepID=A0A0A9C3W6_ARUDO